MDFLNQAFEKVKEIDIVELGREHGKDMQNELLPNDGLCISASTNMTIGNPRISQTKGRKSDKEKTTATEDLRFKSGHDSRTCKKKKDDQLNAANANRRIFFFLFLTIKCPGM
ncbi:hypothetical protein MKX03_014477 [Papaver bracteatum]|nr:hypothetical protein MKX03_014477 [Papaver bracteatum]